MDSKPLILHQFLASHFNEKVRWALDFKGLEHQREDYLPGPHASKIRKKSGGATSTPLLQHGDECISGSAEIIDWLEANYPQQPLYPQDEELQRKALDWQRLFDSELGPATRTALFSVMLAEPGYMSATFGASKSLLKRTLYRGVFPVARSKIAKAYAVDQQETIDSAKAICTRYLDLIATTAQGGRFLVGEQFSVADLAAASLLSPLTSLTHPDMQRRQPIPEGVQDFLRQWQEHPTIAWVQGLYAEFR